MFRFMNEFFATLKRAMPTTYQEIRGSQKSNRAESIDLEFSDDSDSASESSIYNQRYVFLPFEKATFILFLFLVMHQQFPIRSVRESLVSPASFVSRVAFRKHTSDLVKHLFALVHRLLLCGFNKQLRLLHHNLILLLKCFRFTQTFQLQLHIQLHILIKRIHLNPSQRCLNFSTPSMPSHLLQHIQSCQRHPQQHPLPVAFLVVFSPKAYKSS
jgi:hypothetical protein